MRSRGLAISFGARVPVGRAERRSLIQGGHLSLGPLIPQGMFQEQLRLNRVASAAWALGALAIDTPAAACTVQIARP